MYGSWISKISELILKAFSSQRICAVELRPTLTESIFNIGSLTLIYFHGVVLTVLLNGML